MATVFDNIVTKENDHTHLLRSVMEKHPRVAAAVLSHLLRRNISEDAAASLTFKAQSSYRSETGREIPDLVIVGSNVHCLIEVKVDPALELTTAQRNGYVNCFPHSAFGQNDLCFLVPDDWRHTALSHQVRGGLPSSIKCTVSYWRPLIKVLEEAAGAVSDPIVNEAVRFWKWRFEVEPMTNAERNILATWSQDLYGAVSKLEKAVTQAKARFDARDWQTELETDTETFGFYLKRDTSYLLWVGIWTKAPAPLCMGVHARKGDWQRPKDFAIAPAKTHDSLWHLWPLDPMTWDDAEQIYESVIGFINEQYERPVITAD